MSNRPSVILHLLPAADWAYAQAEGAYSPLSLTREGFIHFSTPTQIAAVANAFYRQMPDLLLLIVDPQRLPADALRWEPPIAPTGSGDSAPAPASGDFPHLYAPLPLDAVIATRPYAPDADGVFMAPDGL